MSWSLLDSNTAIFTDGNAGHAFTFPGAASAGDLLVVGVNSDTTVTTPSGYTAAQTDVGNQGCYVFYKVAAGGETAVTITTSGDHETALSFLRYSGATATPGDQVAVTRIINNDIPQASPTVSPSALTGSGELCLLYGMVHHSQSATAVTGVTASSGYTTLLETAASGGLNTTAASKHFVIGRTDGSGSQSPSVSWSGGLFQDRTAIFVSFISGTQTLSPSGIASAEAFGSLTLTGGGAITLSPTGISTAEAIGASTVTGGASLLPTVNSSSINHLQHHSTLHDRHNRNTQVETISSSGSARTLSLLAGQSKIITLSANCTITLSSPVATEVNGLELVIRQDATGSRTISWPASVKWAGGAPTLTTTANAVDRVVLVTYDGGTTWYADLVGKNYA